MIKGNPLHYSANILLYDVFSISQRVLEYIEPTEATKAFLPMHFAADPLVAKLFNLMFERSENAGSDAGSNDALLIAWSDQILACLANLNISIDTSLNAHYFLATWWQRTLTEYDRVIGEQQGGRASHSYRSTLRLRHALDRAVKKILDQTHSRQDIPPEELRTLHSEAFALTEALVKDWNKQVYRLTEKFIGSESFSAESSATK